MSAEAKLYEDAAVTLGEIVKNLKEKHPKVLDKILGDIDLSDEALEEYLALIE